MIGVLAVGRTIARGLRGLARDPRGRGLLILSISLVMGGAFFYRQVEDLSWIDSVDFTVITLTTVGYGDIAPQTVAGKLFTTAYLLIGIGIGIGVAGRRGGRARLRANADDPPDPAD